MCISKLVKECLKYCLVLSMLGTTALSHDLLFAETCTPFPPGQYSSSLCVDPLGNPHVAWEQVLDNGETPSGDPCSQNDIYYTSSPDGGATFLPATAEIDRIPWAQARVSLAIDGDGNPAMAWVDERDSEKHIYFSRSLDGGATFSPGIRIDSSSGRQDRPTLLFDSQGNPVVAWIDTHFQRQFINPVGYIYLTKSADGGATFLPSVCVWCSSRPHQGWPAMVLDSLDNPVIVAHYYALAKECWDVYFIKSVDQGASFTTRVLVEHNLHNQVVPGHHVLVLDSEENPYIAFVDNRSGHWNLRLARSVDGGSSFLPSVPIDSYPARQMALSLGIDASDNLYVAWTDRRSGWYDNIRFAMSQDGGLTFLNSVALDERADVQNRPSLTVDSDHGILHITWTDKKEGIYYVYYTKSTDNGASFLPGIPVYGYPAAQ